MPTSPRVTSNAHQAFAQYIIDNVDELHVVKDLLDTDSTSQALAKSIGSFPYSGSDISANFVSGDFVMTYNGKTGGDPTGTATAGEDSAVIFINSTTQELLKVFDVTDRATTNEDGDRFSIEAMTDLITAPVNVAA